VSSSPQPEPTIPIPQTEPRPPHPSPDRDLDSQRPAATGPSPDDAPPLAPDEPASAEPGGDTGGEDPAVTTERPENRVEDEPIPAALTATRDESQRMAQSRFRGSSSGLIAALVVGATMIAVAALILVREPIVAAVPGAAKIYAMVGLAGEELGSGLDIRDVSSTREPTGESETLVIEGVIANTSNGSKDVPLVRVALFDADNEELQFVTAAPDRRALPPGETVDFTVRLENPAVTARRIKVTFAPRDEKS
jgi:hypothetical protein